jgi:hypothetical protein
LDIDGVHTFIEVQGYRNIGVAVRRIVRQDRKRPCPRKELPL